MRKGIIAFLACLLPLMALAAEKPPELNAAIQAGQPVGQASLSKLWLHVYDVQFWSDSGGWKKTPYALSINYAMGFSTDQLADRTYDEMKNVSALPEATLKSYSAQLRKIYPEVQAGDRITALQKNRETTLFYYNGRPIGTITDAAFALAFFGIWLSPTSSEPEMQKQLLPTP